MPFDKYDKHKTACMKYTWTVKANYKLRGALYAVNMNMNCKLDCALYEHKL